MDYFNLFSHPQEPEFVSSGDTATSAVQQPAFSDGPKANDQGATTPSPYTA
jgi:hypothetical protein